MNEAALDKSLETLHTLLDQHKQGSLSHALALHLFLVSWGREDADIALEYETGRWQVWIDENRIDDADKAVEVVEAVA